MTLTKAAGLAALSFVAGAACAYTYVFHIFTEGLERT